MTLTYLKKHFAVTEYKDVQYKLLKAPGQDMVKYLVRVREVVMRKKTTGKKIVRFRINFESHLMQQIPKEFQDLILEECEIAAIVAVREALDQVYYKAGEK